VLLKLLPAGNDFRRSGGAFVMVNTAVELEVLEEKMPESPWHNKNVEAVKELLEQALSDHPTAVVFRDLFFQFKGKRYAPDLAVVLQGSPPLESIGFVYRVPEDGPAPDAIVEIAVSSKSLGEALGDKVYFYADMGVKDYLVIQAFPEKPFGLWFCRPNLGERPNSANEAFLEGLGLRFLVEGQKVRVFDREGKEIVPIRETLERERKQWKEVEQRLIETLERERKQWKEVEQRLVETLERERKQWEQERLQWKEIEQRLNETLKQERRKREELEKRVAELERKLRGENL
jgi:Uma2 family endonuclease